MSLKFSTDFEHVTADTLQTNVRVQRVTGQDSRTQRDARHQQK